MTDILVTLSQWLQPYKSQMSVALVTTLLVLYGDVINKRVKRLLKPYHFAIRTVAFVAVCTFGYSMLVLLLSPMVKTLLDMTPWPYLPICIIAVAIGLGILAEKRRYI